MKRLALAVVMTACFARVAFADACVPYDTAFRRAMAAMTAEGIPLRIYANKTDGRWLLLGIDPRDATACLLARGDGLQMRPERKA